MKYLPYSRQCLDAADLAAVKNVLQSGWITQGPTITAFENQIARYCDARYAVAVSSGTAALHLAGLAIGLKKGDQAITTPITFLASANCALYAGAKPVFADVEPLSTNISPEDIEKKINRMTRAIIPVHFAGLPCDMERISQIARKHRLTVIEDGCHALGAKYQTRGQWVKVGSSRHSALTVLSFHPVKAITTGEGGVITTNDQKLYKKLLVLRNHGMCKDRKTAQVGPWYYEMRELGFNYRITDLQCALGITQLRKLDKFIARRRAIVQQYHEAFRQLPHVVLPQESEKQLSAYHLYVMQIDFKKIRTTRKKFVEKLYQQGVGTQVHYIPIYRQPYYRKRFHVDPARYPQAETYYERCLSIPLYPTLTDADVKHVISTIKTLMR
jgi:perosamine synthetase